ncbi:MAG: CxxC-x17-CxxC domain-containing protein, partial [Nitrosopumilus sp.]
ILSKNATVVEIEPRFREKFREITEKSFRNESCMEFLENYEKMKSCLPEKFDAKCSDCGTDCQVPFQPKEGRPVYCRECFQNHR